MESKTLHLPLLALAVSALATPLLAAPRLLHGGSYPGPGDTVPPGDGPPGGGPTTGPNPPTSPTGDGPSPPTPGSGVPGQPGNPRGRNPRTGGRVDLGPDLTHWSYWWDLNKAGFLNLKANVEVGAVGSGPGDHFWLGKGQVNPGTITFRPSLDQIQNTVVPALLEALRTENHNDIVTGSMLALAKIGDEAGEDGSSRFAELFVEQLSSSNQEIAESAAIALGVLGHESVVPLLTSLLRDDATGREVVGSTEVSYRTRAFAAYGLALVARATSDERVHSAVVAELAATLRDDRSSTRDVQVACVIALGLVPLRSSGQLPADPVEVPATLEEQVALLSGFLSDEKSPRLARAHVPTSLARLVGAADSPLKTAVAEDLLARLDKFSDEPNDVLRGCAIALGLLGDRDDDELDVRIRAMLIELEKLHPDQLTRNLSLISLGEVGARPGAGSDAAEGLAEVQRHLETVLSKGKTALRPWAALGTGVLGYRLRDARDDVPRGFGAPLRELVASEKSPTELGAYAIAAGLLRDEEAVPALRERLAGTSNPEARGLVAVALGMVGAREEMAAIQEVVRASEYRPELLRRSAIGLGLMGDKDIVDDLMTMLLEAGSLSSQASICSALGFIGDKRSVDPLVHMLGEQEITSTARGFAAVALGLVCEEELLPWNYPISHNLNYGASTESLADPTGNGNGIVNIL